MALDAERDIQHIHVKATAVGFYAGHRRRVGAIFKLDHPKHLRKSWMQPIEADEVNAVPVKSQERQQAEREHISVVKNKPIQKLQPNGVDPIVEAPDAQPTAEQDVI